MTLGPTPRNIGTRIATPLLITLTLAALTYRLFLLTNRYAVNIFFWDQWDFNDATLFQYHSLWDIFRWQHGPHRQGLGGLLAVFLEPWFNWNSRTEAFLAVTIVVTAALCALYLKYRLFGSLSWSDLIIPLVILSPVQWESLWNTVNLSHGVLPILLVLLYCLLWTWQDQRFKVALIVLLNFGIIYTGFGFFIDLLTPVLLIASYRASPNQSSATKAYFITCIFASVASIASFFVGYHPDSASGCSSLVGPSPIPYFWFMDLMLVNPFGLRGVGIYAKLGGSLIFISIAATAALSWTRLFARRGESLTRYLAPAVLSLYAILFCVSAAVGRACLGLAPAHASRYSNYVQLGILSLYFCILAWNPKRHTWCLSAALLLLLLPSVRINPFDLRAMQQYSGQKASWRACYLGGHTIDECDHAFGPIYPDPGRTRLKEKLDYLENTQQNLYSEQ
jgi:hypothetical protein